jgi:hypothetical protein
MSTPPSPFNATALQESIAVHAAERKRLAEFLATGALYTHFAISESAKKFDELPETIELHCGMCGKEQTFERVRRMTARGPAIHSGSDRGSGRIVSYQCRNCAKKQQAYMYVWNDNGFWKVGQLPELQEYIDPKLNKALGSSAPLYRKAVRSRSFGFGIGAVSYLRRIVEDKTDALMDLVKDEKWDTWDEAERAEFENARTTYQYSQKIEYAAEKILPASAFANGRDSFTALHDVTSSGLHGKTEDECIAIFDRCNLIFTRTFQMLHDHKSERDEFAAQLLALKR